MIGLLALVTTPIVLLGLSIARRAKVRPGTPAPVVRDAVAPRPDWSGARRLRILVVDDRALVGAQVARLLPAHDVTRVTTAQAAVRAGEFDAILYAIAMPGLSGLAFADLLPAPQRPCLVFMLDHAPSSAMLDKIERAGARWVTKPLRYAPLALALDAAAGAQRQAPPALASAA